MDAGLKIRINGFGALTLGEKSYAMKELQIYPDLIATWSGASDEELISHIKEISASNDPFTEKKGFYSNFPVRALDLPLENRDNAIMQLFNLIVQNWNTRNETAKQKHHLGLLFGLAGIGKTTMLCEQIIKEMMYTKAFIYNKELHDALKNAIYIYLDLSNGDRVNPNEDLTNVIGSRIYSHISENRSWNDRSNTSLDSKIFTPEKVFRWLGESLNKIYDKWRAVFIMVDECQYISNSEEQLRSFINSITAITSSSKEKTIASTYKLFIIPIFSGTVDEVKMKRYNQMSGYTMEFLKLPVLSASNVINSVRKYCEIKNIKLPALEIQKVQTIITTYGAIPRMLEDMVKVMFNNPNITDPELLEKKFNIQFLDAYSPEKLLSALEPNTLGIVIVSLLGFKKSFLPREFQDKLSIALDKGCLQIDNDYIILPYNVFRIAIANYSIDLTLPFISQNLKWQDFEKIIAQYQTLRARFIGCSLNDLLPGVVTATKWPIIGTLNQPLLKDLNWCIHNNTYTPNLNSNGFFNGEVPSGVFLCLSCNPVFDIRISVLDSNKKCHLIWEQLRHEEIDVKSHKFVTKDMIENWYQKAKMVVKDKDLFPFDPLLVYITNKEPDNLLFLEQFVQTHPNLGVITKQQFPIFFPPVLLPLVMNITD